jgi:hypothetical protein
VVGGPRFIARCAAVLPAVWLVLFLLALPFPGGHPSLLSLVLIVPTSLSLTGRAVSAVAGGTDTSALSLFVAVLGTVVELGFIGVVAGLAARCLVHREFRRHAAWFAAGVIYIAGHALVDRVATSRSVTSVVLSMNSPRLRHNTLQRVVRDRDRSYRGVLLSVLEKGSEPDVDEEIIAALTSLEDGAFWHDYAMSPRGSRWGVSLLSKVQCELSNQSAYLQRAPGVDFARLTESFARLNGMVFERMVAELPNRPELLKPIFGIAGNNPELGRAEFDRLFDLLQRPSIAKCVRLPIAFRSEWSVPSHPSHRLYELANATCQEFSKADLRLWLSPDESVTGPRHEPFNATALCQFVIDTEGMDRKGRHR